MGHVQGLLFDDDTWAIRYFIVDTSNWWVGHQVLVAPRWIQDISWPDATVAVSLTQQALSRMRRSTTLPYQCSRDLEMGLYEHHGRAGYWADEVNLSNPQFRAREKRPSL
jgi:hypothetical protein